MSAATSLGAAPGGKFASLRKQTARALRAHRWPRVLAALAAEYATPGPLSVALVHNNLTAIATLRFELSVAVGSIARSRPDTLGDEDGGGGSSGADSGKRDAVDSDGDERGASRADGHRAPPHKLDRRHISRRRRRRRRRRCAAAAARVRETRRTEDCLGAAPASASGAAWHMTAADVRPCAAMPPTCRGGHEDCHAVACLAGGIYVVCGDAFEADCGLWRCDARAGRPEWRRLPKPPLPLSGTPTLLAVADRWLWLFSCDDGAYDWDSPVPWGERSRTYPDSRPATTQVFDVASERWARGPTLRGKCRHVAYAATCGRRIYVFRAQDGATSAHVEYGYEGAAYTCCQTLDAVAAATAAFGPSLPGCASDCDATPASDCDAAPASDCDAAPAASWLQLPDMPVCCGDALAYVTAGGRVRFDTECAGVAKSGRTSLPDGQCSSDDECVHERGEHEGPGSIWQLEGHIPSSSAAVVGYVDREAGSGSPTPPIPVLRWRRVESSPPRNATLRCAAVDPQELLPKSGDPAAARETSNRPPLVAPCPEAQLPLAFPEAGVEGVVCARPDFYAAECDEVFYCYSTSSAASGSTSDKMEWGHATRASSAQLGVDATPRAWLAPVSASATFRDDGRWLPPVVLPP